MKQISHKILALIVSVLFASCAKDERLMYNEAPAVYFNKAGQGDADSVDYTFGMAPESMKEDSVFLWVKIIGVAEDRDREFNLRVVEGATAKEGYHYKIGRTVIPAGAYEARIPVYVYRKAGLKDSTVTATFELLESADFKLGFPDKGFNSKYDRLHYKLSITDKLLKPGNWETVWQSFFGSYSLVKFQFLIQATGVTNWNAYPFPQNSRFMVQQAKLALLEYQQTNGPLIDENDQEVYFP